MQEERRMLLLCGSAVVVFQHSTETRTQPDGADIFRMIPTSLDQSVVDSLVVLFRVVMLNVLVDRISEMPLTEDDHSIKALRFYRSDETFSEGVQVQAFRWEFHTTDTSSRERRRKLRRVQRVTIMNEIAFPEEESVKAVCQIPRHLVHPGSIRSWRNACDLNSTRRELDGEKHHVANEAERRPYLHREEVAGRKGVPVITNELVPRSLSRTLGR